jgi:hypothetical protein
MHVGNLRSAAAKNARDLDAPERFAVPNERKSL